MLRKAAIRQANTVKGVFLSALFLVKKKKKGRGEGVNASNKSLSTSILSIQNGRARILDICCKRNIICNLKDAYYCLPLQKSSRKYFWFHCSGNLYEFSCLCFDLRPVPRIFTKLLKISNAILRRINIMVIYLNDRLLICHSMKEISMCRYTVMFWLKHLGFLINWKKSVLTAV